MRFTTVLLFATTLAASACSSDDNVPPAAHETPAARAASSCTNGVQDGDETDVDCGGACGSNCALGQRCTLDECAGDAICAAAPASSPDEAFICQQRVRDCSACAAGTLCRVFMEGGTPSSTITYCQPVAK